MRLLRRALVGAATVVFAACSSGGVTADAPIDPTLATAPSTTIDLCSLLQDVADDVDSVSETAPPDELERSLDGVIAFTRHAGRIAPPEVAADVDIVTDLYATLIGGLESAGWDWGAFTASDAALRVADIRSDPATGAALDAVSSWSRTHC